MLHKKNNTSKTFDSNMITTGYHAICLIPCREMYTRNGWDRAKLYHTMSLSIDNQVLWIQTFLAVFI